MSNNMLNIKIEVTGLEGLTQALVALAEAFGGKGHTPAQSMQPAAAPVSPAPVSTTMPAQQPQIPAAPAVPVLSPQAPQTPAAPVPAVPVAPTMPTQQPQVPTAQPSQVPTTAVPSSYTTDELAVAASQLVNMGKQDRLFEILHGFGVNSLMELPQDKYGAFAGCLKAEGVKI